MNSGFKSIASADKIRVYYTSGEPAVQCDTHVFQGRWGPATRLRALKFSSTMQSTDRPKYSVRHAKTQLQEAFHIGHSPFIITMPLPPCAIPYHSCCLRHCHLRSRGTCPFHSLFHNAKRIFTMSTSKTQKACRMNVSAASVLL